MLTLRRPTGEATLNIPEVSICIPAYNGDQFISQAIESALAQTFTNLEIIVVDDGSKDGTVEIAESYAVHDSRVRVYRNAQNLGLPRNWDRCRDLATGNWIMFLFQDDLFRPDCVKHMVRSAIENSAQLVCCRRNFTFFPEVSEATRNYFLTYTTCHNFARYFPNRTFVPAREFCAQLVRTPTVNFIGEPSAVLLQRSTAEIFGRFHPVLVQLVDFEYWARIAVQRGIAYVDEPLVMFRVHGKSATAQNAQASVRIDWLDGIVMLHDFLHAPAYTNLRSSLKNRALLYRHYVRGVAKLKQGRDGRDPHYPSWPTALKHYPELQHAGLITRTVELAYRLWRWSRKPH
jgi:glycosyltransferase involved in cell wall biosynthesis